MFNGLKQPCDEAAIMAGSGHGAASALRGRWVLAAAILGSSMTFIDGTVVNVALPIIQADLNGTASQAQWVVESYALMLSCLILVGGAFGDKYGRRFVFSVGVVWFAAASVLCASAQGIGQLIAARTLQGIGAAMLVPGSLAIISASFSRKDRAKAIGTWSGFTAIAAGFGPVLGGWLADNLSWRWIFYINVPLAAAIVVISIFRVPESRDETAKGRPDLAGAATATIGMGGVVFGLVESGPHGFGSTRVWLSILVGLFALAAFVWVESKAENPMMPLKVFRSKTFAGANLLTLFLYAGLSAIMFFLPFNLIQLQGYDAVAAGAALVPFVITMSLLSRWSSGLIERFGAKMPLVIGPLIAGAGFALFALPGASSVSYWRDFFPAVMVMSLGMAISVAPLTTAVMSAVDERHAGVASGINNTVSRTAGLLAIAVFGIVMLAAFDKNLAPAAQRAGLPTEAMAELNFQRNKLAAASLPETFAPDVRDKARSVVGESFLYGFRIIALFCAGLAVLSAFSSWRLIEGKKIKSSK
ncbi:MAG TPA: MFS transporter [Pyrinomonadaceae bacterium]|nr:MFS transporter [Pyrinomonadaceae bacterium]